MSTFNGRIPDDLPGFSIDRFDGPNLESHVFFLSHCHADHMHGFHSSEFLQLIQQNEHFLYMSSVSAAIIRKSCAEIWPKIKVLDPYEAEVIKNVRVWTVPAGHCPGSVMFLFETQNKNILYTGDFRIETAKQLTKFKAFQSAVPNQTKRIDDIYMDTTFFYKEYKWFPRRDESVARICALIEEKWAQDKETEIVLSTSAKYGYEYLFIQLYKRFKQPIYIQDEQIFRFYQCIPEMDAAITSNPENVRIRTGGGRWSFLGGKQFVIRISAWKWQSNALQDGIDDGASVCYSTHPSYDETIEFVNFLKPKHIYPNVIQDSKKSALDENIRNCLENEAEENSVENRLQFRVKNESFEKNDEGDVFVHSGLLDSPPAKKKAFRSIGKP